MLQVTRKVGELEDVQGVLLPRIYSCHFEFPIDTRKGVQTWQSSNPSGTALRDEGLYMCKEDIVCDHIVHRPTACVSLFNVQPLKLLLNPCLTRRYLTRHWKQSRRI